MTTKRIEIDEIHRAPDHVLAAQLKELFSGIDARVFKRRFYLIEGKISDWNLVYSLFFDPLLEQIILDESEHLHPCDWVIEVSYLPGVTDNPGRSAKMALEECHIQAEVSSGQIYFIEGKTSEGPLLAWAQEHLGNPLIQRVSLLTYHKWSSSKRFTEPHLPKVQIDHDHHVQTINIDMTDEEAESLIVDRCLALSLGEWNHLKNYFKSDTVQEQRLDLGMPKLPTDVEIEIIAQSWSEHCKHKIFSANIEYSECDDHGGVKLESSTVKSLYKSLIKKATFDAKEKHNIDWLISVFSDNAGIVRFDSEVDLCIKVETHNSPSALDPYGGSLTGILGVNRDIMGTGMGARPIANTDVFCFGSPRLPAKDNKELMPAGVKSPRNIFRGVHKGIEDGGNKSGIPTVNGSFFFDNSYCGKPLVFCGTVGVLPQQLPDGRQASGKHAKAGDAIIVIGGAVGADGIHGATFSSLELNESSPATAVQIGDPLTQRRCLDFLIEARDLGYFSSITDNGAGGISSSLGEMARETGGAQIDLSQCTLKYPGLSPWEIMISESQERMSLAVPQKYVTAFCSLAQKRGVDAQVLGSFTDSGFFEIFHAQQRVAYLSLEWLHESLPPMQLKAHWDGPRPFTSWLSESTNKKTIAETTWDEVLLKILGSDNVASKERWVRRYDHEVQGATHLKPYVSLKQTSPSNAGAIWLKPHGGSEKATVYIGHGLAPRYSPYDPYFMAQAAVDESVRNIVVQGANPEQICLLDNFCWPDPVASLKNPDGEYKLGQLVRTCYGLYDIAVHYGHPFVSGKDSMKNDFRGKNKRGESLQISILPTLLVTAMGSGSLATSTRCYFPRAGLKIGLLGKPSGGLMASEFEQFVLLNLEHKCLPEISIDQNKKRYSLFHQACVEQLIESATDISDGGLLVALSELSFAERLGIRFTDDVVGDWIYLFNESPGQLVIAFDHENEARLNQIFQEDLVVIGETISEPIIEIPKYGKQVFDLNRGYQAWNKSWSEVDS